MATEINLTLTGYRADEVLPEESGEYLVFKVFSSVSGMFTDMHYSASHNAWNAYDHQDADFVDKNHIDGITHWFRLPEAPEAKGADIHG